MLDTRLARTPTTFPNIVRSVILHASDKRKRCNVVLPNPREASPNLWIARPPAPLGTTTLWQTALRPSS